MFKHKQLIANQPGRWGDCYRTAVACLLELPPEEVPHFYEEAVADDAEDKWDFNKAIPAWINSWLAERGIVRMMVTINGEAPMVLHYCSLMSGGMPYLLSGINAAGASHVIICQGSKMVWDPSPTEGGLAGPLRFGSYLFEALVKPLETIEVDHDAHTAALQLNMEMINRAEKGELQ